MAERTIRVSDLSGRTLAPDDAVARLVVLEHPDIDRPVQLEALVHEITGAIDTALSVAVFEVYLPGRAEPQRVVLEASDFDALALDAPMADVLKMAPAAKPAKSSPRAATGINYASLEHAGTPHRGRVTEAEARLVREHLDVVNTRLARDGLRQINPAAPTDAERYGFGAPTGKPDAS